MNETATTAPGEPVKLLLVEDDDVDVMGVKRAFKTLKIANPLFIAHDGIEALEYLRGENGREKVTSPYIILLDLNMPRMNGIEFLNEIRNDPDLRQSIVFVLTTSARDEDKVKAYDHNIAGYMLKSDPTKSFQEAMQLLDYYWTIVELPS